MRIGPDIPFPIADSGQTLGHLQGGFAVPERFFLDFQAGYVAQADDHALHFTVLPEWLVFGIQHSPFTIGQGRFGNETLNLAGQRAFEMRGYAGINVGADNVGDRPVPQVGGTGAEQSGIRRIGHL